MRKYPFTGRRTTTVTFTVTPEEKTWLREQAKQEGSSVAAMIRDDALRLYRIEQLIKETERIRERARDEARRSRESAGRTRTRRTAGGFVDLKDAEAWLRSYTNAPPSTPINTVLRRACHRAHPDKGGQPADWAKVDLARRLLIHR